MTTGTNIFYTGPSAWWSGSPPWRKARKTSWAISSHAFCFSATLVIDCIAVISADNCDKFFYGSKVTRMLSQHQLHTRCLPSTMPYFKIINLVRVILNYFSFSILMFTGAQICSELEHVSHRMVWDKFRRTEENMTRGRDSASSSEHTRDTNIWETSSWYV